MRQPPLIADFVELLAAKADVVGSGAGQLPLPVSKCTAGLPMSPDGYYHGVSARYEFNVLRLFPMNHIIEHIGHGAVLIEHGVQSVDQRHLYLAAVGFLLQQA